MEMETIERYHQRTTSENKNKESKNKEDVKPTNARKKVNNTKVGIYINGKKRGNSGDDIYLRNFRHFV